MELERIKYVLRCYLKLRLKKLQRYALFVIERDLMDRLSPQESTFISGYCDLIGDHLSKMFLCQLPEKLQSLTDAQMIEQPPLDRHVFVYVEENVGDFQLDEEGLHTELLERGDTWVLRYRSVRRLVESGQLRLI